MSTERQLNQELRVRVSEKRRMEIEEIVDERSEPGERVTLSDVLRDAIDEYVEDHHPDE